MSDLITQEDLKKVDLDMLFQEEKAKEMFNLLANELSVAGSLYTTDFYSLVDMCNTYHDILMLRKECSETPMVDDVTDNAYGNKVNRKSNPLWRTLRDQQRTFLLYAKEFGTTPRAKQALLGAFQSGKTALPVNDDNNDDDDEDLM